jgi:hypothetical protein
MRDYFGDSADGLERQAHRAALDHVLTLVADAPCGESLVLRGTRP